MSVLIIDDYPNGARALVRLLRARGIDAWWTDPTQGDPSPLLLAQEGGCVVMDYTGHPVAEWMEVARTPVILWSGDDSAHHPRARAVVGKTDLNGLLAAIEGCL